MPRCCSEARKHRNMIAGARKKMGIFLEVTYQKSPKTDPFSEGIIQKTENWHFGVHRIWGGGRYQSSIGICQGPTSMYKNTINIDYDTTLCPRGFYLFVKLS